MRHCSTGRNCLSQAQSSVRIMSYFLSWSYFSCCKGQRHAVWLLFGSLVNDSSQCSGLWVYVQRVCLVVEMLLVSASDSINFNSVFPFRAHLWTGPILENQLQQFKKLPEKFLKILNSILVLIRYESECTIQNWILIWLEVANRMQNYNSNLM